MNDDSAEYEKVLRELTRTIFARAKTGRVAENDNEENTE